MRPKRSEGRALGQTEDDGVGEGRSWLTDIALFFFCFHFFFQTLLLFLLVLFVGCQYFDSGLRFDDLEKQKMFFRSEGKSTGLSQGVFSSLLACFLGSFKGTADVFSKR